MSGRRRTRGSVSIDLDDRGRVPFALIAVLLLLSSVMIVATLETRPDPTTDRDTEIAMDRAVAQAQGELRTAVLEASYRAGMAPINSSAESEVDAIADADDRDERFENYVKLLVYLEATDTLSNAGGDVRSDVTANVSIPAVTSSGDDESIDPDEAIDRVDLDIGHFDADVETGTVAATVEAVEFRASRNGGTEVEQSRPVTVSVGTPVFELNDRLTEYETQLNSGFFDESIGSSLDGLGQHLGARLYPFAYFKAGWDRMQPTRGPDQHDFEEVIDVKHTEVLANHAIFDVQNDVFGTQDPYADRTMRPGFICLATQIGNDLAGGDSSDGTEQLVDQAEADIGTDAEGVEDGTVIDDVKEQLCDGGEVQEWLFGDEATGELPNMPDLSDLLVDGLGEMDVMDGTEEVPLEDVAQAAYMEYSVEEAQDIVGWMEDRTSDEVAEGNIAPETDIDDGNLPAGDDEYDRSVRDIVEELYQVDLERETESVHVSGGMPDADSPDDRANYTESDDTTVVDSVSDIHVDHDTFEDGDSSDRTLHEVSAAAELDLERSQTWESDDPENVTPRTKTFITDRTVSLSADIAIDGEYGFDRQGEYYDRDEFPVEDRPIESDYESGYTDDDGWRDNFEEGFKSGITALTTAETNGSVRADFTDDLESLEGETISSTETIEDDTEAILLDSGSSEMVELDDLKPDSEDTLIKEVRSDLEETHHGFLEVIDEHPFEVERTEMMETPTPPERAIEHVQNEYEDNFVYDDLEGETYETPAAETIAQVRKAYFDRLYYWLELVAEPYEDGLDEMGEHVDDAGGSGMDALDDVLGFTQDALNADVDYEPDDIEGSPVLEDAQFEAAGSPTYLTAENISEDRDPAVRPEDDTITDVGGETEHAPMAIHTDNRVGWPGVPLIPYPPALYLAQLNSWNVEVRGEYARFEVSATVGDASSGDRLSFVREHRPIELELEDGEKITVGANNPVDFESTIEVIVMMPGGVMGSGGVPSVADPGESIDDGIEHCSPTWDFVGPDYNSDSVAELECHPK
ncbi:hypothetical protein [Halostagnicola sp. A-GB9-2]|uniref:DUF7286 family protein n=1 Tax=Halostagnicola sp. A-GB9-2 TaxID=3048066 RepID=UPI0024BFCEB4|nr:hypothetical protein [Halostagnicola sp. A-GB9-2]MDJ1431436.1 hypothetical protein [Halostagnicola sp. A-GB9-2]